MAKATTQFTAASQAGKFEPVTAGDLFLGQRRRCYFVRNPNPNDSQIGRFVVCEDLAIFCLRTVSEKNSDLTFVVVVRNDVPSGYTETLTAIFDSLVFIDIDNDSCPNAIARSCLLYTSPSPRDRQKSRMPSSA